MCFIFILVLCYRDQSDSSRDIKKMKSSPCSVPYNMREKKAEPWRQNLAHLNGGEVGRVFPGLCLPEAHPHVQTWRPGEPPSP